MSAPYDLITSDPWRMLRFLARRVINLEHNLPDSLGGEEAFLEELPFGLQIFVCKINLISDRIDSINICFVEQNYFLSTYAVNVHVGYRCGLVESMVARYHCLVGFLAMHV